MDAPNLSHGITTPDEMIYEIDRLKQELAIVKPRMRLLEYDADRLYELSGSFWKRLIFLVWTDGCD